MSLSMKRYWYLIVIAILFLGILCCFGSKRVISINIGEKGDVTTGLFDIDNTIDLFDSTQVHEINILMSAEKYQSMIDSYSETSEKERFKTDIIIDGITVNDVGVRLKGNSTLRGGGGKGGMMNDGGGMMKKFKNGEGMPDLPRMDGDWPNEFDMPQDFGSGKFPDFSFDLNSQNLPLLIKFDKFVNQTYQGHEMLSIRLGGGMGGSQKSGQTFLEEPYTYELYQQMGQPSPDTSYGYVIVAGKTGALYELSELPEDKYFLNKWFDNGNGILYKAGNFVDFSYQGDDPTLYSDSFDQKTRVNDYDMAPLIRLLKFVSSSNDDEFESEIDNYIDVKSVLMLMAIDEFVGNNDSFGGMSSNYYLYYDLNEKKFYILTWDQNLAFGGMGGKGGQMGGLNVYIREFDDFTGLDVNNRNSGSGVFDLKNFSQDMRLRNNMTGGKGGKGGMGRNGNNLLKQRLLANENFSLMYNEFFQNVKNTAINTDFSINFFDVWIDALLEYNEINYIIDENDYLNGVEKIKNQLK